MQRFNKYSWTAIEVIMLSEIGQTQKDKYCMTSHICEIKKKPNSWKQRVECWLPGTEGWGQWEDVGQRTQTSSYEMNKFWGI